DIQLVEDMLKEYEAEHADANALEKMELEQAKKLYSVFEELGFYAGGLFLEGKLIAFSIGEIVNRTLMIHVEKALTCYKGVYPTMYSGFVRLIDSLAPYPLYYVNREDDSGDPGLRTSKMQYQPSCIVHKYLVHIASPAAKMGKEYLIKGEGICLTEFRDSDKQAYLELNTDVENNRYWGYDYREDLYLSDPIDENTFYDSLQYDLQTGDSINFAIRLSENGEMIGETILWNFTSDGYGELGCRILPEYQGKGYGRAAFIACSAYAEKVLGMKVTARCCLENKASYKMISSTGCFSQTGKDETYYYFERR
ncbi:MAG: GNAT family N-acetyltransferase, partial [Erysipelotrichaceae bacterium]|nr:GNAT family N-acetyltransferase [Erysipelotrichaceae bacterium]